jgi:hypothetical protein
MSKLEVDAIEPQSGTSLTLGASGDTITIPSGATLSSTDPLVFPAGTVSLPAITTTGDTNTGIFFPAADTIAFTEGGAEAMRIDSSGNVLINTTDASTLTAGIKLRASDNAIAAVVTSNPSGYFGRLSTDGDIIKFRKDSTTVGSIGVVNSNNLFIQGDSTNSGLQCGTNTILPVQNGANASNTIDMGDGSNLWKDLYLGGGLYVGGTGSANKLDDYEEGTWTPTVIGTTVAGTATYTTQLGRYTKIGNIVNLYFAVNWSSGTGTGNLRISGLPFSAINGTNSSYFPTGMLAGNSLTFSVNTPYISVVNNSALIDVGQMSSGATNVKVAYDSSANINGSITYETN